MVKWLIRLTCLIVCLPVLAAAGELFPWAEFDPEIPTQEEILGFEPGARPMTHGELMRYLEALADSSPRARITTYAHSHEGRRLVYLAVSDEATIARLEEFRDEHRARVDPRGRRPAEDEALLEQAKAVAWVAYGIHGDELSSVDAAAAVAYWLVAGEDDRARKLRRELVVLIDPCENPDGRDRYLAQVRSFAHAVPNPDQDDLSHTSVWPWGRGNHYLFDLNRDWFSMVHPESRRSAVIASWNPQLAVDSHEMGANDTYLFPPPRHPFNPHLPSSHRRWWDRFAADQAKALDERGYPYYTREWNEEFFPGYGSSWASYHGAIGILYEMSRTSGTLVRKRSGEVRTYPQAIEHQVASSVANIETLAAHRAAILLDFVDDRRAAIRRGTEGPVRAWLLPEGRNPERTRRLVRLLRAQGVQILRNTTSPPRISGLRDARTGNALDPDLLPEAVWLVRLDQPAAPLARVLLDPHIPMQAPFFREEREHLERGKGTRLYETTAWSLPLCWDLPAYWTGELPGEGWDEAEVPAAEGFFVEQAADAFGYLLDGVPDASAPALAELLQRGIAVRVADKPFTVGGRAYDRGALLVQREGNPEDLAARLAEVAGRFEVRVAATGTARAEQGPDLGGRHFRPLIAPRVGILTGSPVSPSSYGALWHLMDEVLRLRFSGLDVSRFGSTDLERYNVLVFPSTYGGTAAYRAILGPSGLERLKGWIRGGGTAIGIGGGAEFLADVETGLTRTRLRRQALELYPPVVLGPGPELARDAGLFRAVGVRAPQEPKTEPSGSPYDVAPILGPGARPFAEGHEQGRPAEMKPVDLAEWLEPFLAPGKSAPEKEDLERADARLRRFRPRGALLRLELDPQLWLAWGLGEELPALTRARDTLVAEPPVQVAARFADLDRLHLGGVLWPEAAGRLARTAYVTREAVGRGQVILFSSDPEFRAWTLGTRRLLVNAVLLGPGLGTRWSRPW